MTASRVWVRGGGRLRVRTSVARSVRVVRMGMMRVPLDLDDVVHRVAEAEGVVIMLPSLVVPVLPRRWRPK